MSYGASRLSVVAGASQVNAPQPEHDARVLTGGGQRATITLDGQAYTLTITKAGKLILTK